MFRRREWINVPSLIWLNSEKPGQITKQDLFIFFIFLKAFLVELIIFFNISFRIISIVIFQKFHCFYFSFFTICYLILRRLMRKEDLILCIYLYLHVKNNVDLLFELWPSFWRVQLQQFRFNWPLPPPHPVNSFFLCFFFYFSDSSGYILNKNSVLFPNLGNLQE